MKNVKNLEKKGENENIFLTMEMYEKHHMDAVLPLHLREFITLDSAVFCALPDVARKAMIDMAQKCHNEREEVRLERERIQHEADRVQHEADRVHEEKRVVEMQLSVDSFQASLSDLGTTRSVHKISKTKEYFELRLQLIERIKIGTVSLEMAQEILKTFIGENIKANDRERARQYRGRIKDDVERQSRDHVARFRVVNYDVLEVRPDMLIFYDMHHLCEFQGYVFQIPTKGYIEQCVMVSKHRLSEDVGIKRNVYYLPQVSLRLLGANRFPTNTKMLVIDQEYDWYTELCNSIVERLSVLENPDRYDEAAADVTWVLIVSVVARELKCITSWFDTDVERIIKYEDFTLFTANDPSVPCVKQCLEFLGKAYDDALPDDMLQQLRGHRIKVYTPIYHISCVRRLGDLKEVHDTHPYLMDITDDCKGIVRLVEYKDHVGVIMSMEPPKTGFGEKRVKDASSPEWTNVHADIETFVEVESGRVVPYLVCWKYDKDVHKEHGKGCVERFVDRLVAMESDIILHCWNGSAYDFQLLLGVMKRMCVKDKIFVRDSKVVSARMWFRNSTIVLRDPYLFIPCSLGKAAMDFGVSSKGCFPHDAVKSFEDLDRVLERWYALREEIIIENDTSNPKIKIFRCRNWHEHLDGPNDESVLQRAIEYCTLDVLCCEAVWNKFTQVMKGEFCVNISHKHFTTPQVAFEILRSMMPNVVLRTPSREQYEFIRKSIYGGRVVAKNGIYHSKKGLAMLDVVSLYPYAMKTYKYPHGMEYITDKIDWTRLGVYEVTLTSDKEPQNYAQMVPFREDTGRLSYTWRPSWQGVYNTYDLISAKESGYDIKVSHGMEWPHSSDIFSTFVDKLFHIKKHSTGALRIVAKLALNGAGYGKFIQKPIDEDVSIVMKVHARICT
eukprot:TRINITY_DN5458_c0_g1_i8.p1 TRINITY_DN5458_c0_g1~~TRINITY_DN5458_c0_g1_i8.p1  ORF type:complete len:898 (+),score=42.61 TRINITY_DN5458_c0_g1_i8:279-2972(+)